ncbi:APC family permease [Acidiphilium sp. AL]|uniref:APC family permease n=1 Tax=Acidiphilium iwatense TaxID=768198 RepID=A0ABS9DTV4_9PROT|nr:MULTISPECIES: APC family permease [Acidiphilium]MCF3945605.1 APC family permease [Acidiphilium iwatense]MCU4159590.1 APC family permease [Acidiphilium sp. AL]
MSEQATSAPAQSLKKGSLNLVELTGLSLANMAPAYSAFTTIGLIVATVGLGAPLLFVIAGVATIFHVNSTAEYSRKCPSAGSYTCFVSRTFGDYVGASIGVFFAFSWIVSLASVYVVIGNWTMIMLDKFMGIKVNFVVLTLIFAALTILFCIRGVVISSKMAISLFIFELVILFGSGAALVILNPHFVNFRPFSFSSFSSGLKGIGLAFPLAVYPFIGASNAAAMAEEAQRPHATIRKAVFAAAIFATFAYVFCAWSTVVGFRFDTKALAHTDFPMISAVGLNFGGFVFVMYLAGLTSTLALLLASTNAGARIFFNLGREGLFPDWMARIHPRHRTPSAAILFVGIGCTIVAVVLGGVYGPINAFNWLGTIGTIPLILVYILVNIGLPIYFKREYPAEFSVFTHVVLPVLGILAYIIPLWSIVEPGQPAPYNSFGWLTLLGLILAIFYGIYVNKTQSHRLNLGIYVKE